MKKFLINILFFFALISNQRLSAQYVYDWSDYYGGDAVDNLYSLTKIYDGNIFLLGQAKDTVDALWLIKISPEGTKLWSKRYLFFPMFEPVKIIETSDSNLLVVATVAEKDSVPYKIWIAKFDIEGEVLWEKIYTGKGEAYVADIKETFDKGFILAGSTTADVHDFRDWYILKIDSLGFYQWDKSYGSPYDDRALSVDQMYDSTLIIAGYISYSYGGFKKASYSRVSNSGVDIWYDELKLGEWSTANSVIATSDSAFIILTEIKTSPLINFDMKVIKLTPTGDTIWTRTIYKPAWQHPLSIIETYDQGYALVFTTKSNGIFKTDISVIKYNQMGKLIWEKTFKRKSDDFASQIIEGKDNALIISASTYSLGKSWNYGVLKYKSIEISDLIFVTPKDEIATVYNQILNINAYITGYKKPKEVVIYINKKHIITVTKFKLLSRDVTNKYELNLDLKLENGYNLIEFFITDYKDFKFSKIKQIYYLPQATPHW